MELRGIRGGNKDELYDKQYSIYVGVSLGNKWFSVKNVAEITRWALRYTKDDTTIVIADIIHAVNIEVRKDMSYDAALRRAKRLGDRFLDDFQDEARSSFTPEELARVSYARWEDIVTTDYKQKVSYLYSVYEEGGGFAEYIKDIVRDFVLREDRKFSEEDIHRFGHYILEELPELVNRIPIGETIYDAYAYPFDGPINKLVEGIQAGRMFPEIKSNIMDTAPKVFLEVR